MAKPICKCKTYGCAHFHGGFCRLLECTNGKCVMSIRRYHYACCPFLNSSNGQALLKIYCEERGIDVPEQDEPNPKQSGTFAEMKLSKFQIFMDNLNHTVCSKIKFTKNGLFVEYYPRYNLEDALIYKELVDPQFDLSFFADEKIEQAQNSG